jgi:hypothetical protein
LWSQPLSPTLEAAQRQAVAAAELALIEPACLESPKNCCPLFLVASQTTGAALGHLGLLAIG